MEANDPRHVYWKQTRRVGMIIMGVIALMLFLIPFISFISGISFFGFPLDFYMLCQGFILLLIGAGFWFSIHQENLDRSHRMSEDI